MFKRITALLIVLVLFANINAFAATDEELLKISQLEEYAQELSSLIDELNSQGIKLDYEELNLFILEKYIGYIKEDIENGDETRVAYTISCLEEIYNETKENLTAYKNGEKEPKEVVRYKVSDETYDGNTVYGNVFKNGEIVKSPIFKIGYTSHNDARSELNNMKTYGVNTISYSLSMRDVIKPKNFITGFSEGIKSTERTIEFYQTDEFVTDGEKGLKFVATQGSSYDYLYQNVVLEPNTTYEFGADAKSDGAYRAFITVRRTETTGAKIDISKTELTSYKKEFTTGASDGAFQIRIGASDATDGTYIDNLYLKKKDDDTNILLNQSFENLVTPYNDEYGIDNEVLDDFVYLLDKAKENDIAVSAIVNLHEYPKFILNKYPNLSTKFSTYIPYNITDKILRESIGTFLNSFANAVKNETALTGICLLNEPEYDTRLDTDYYNEYWYDYLETKHKTIEKLNDIYNTSYTDFNQITMPASSGEGAVFYDWKLFNEEIFADYVSFLRSKVKEVSEIPVFFKTMVSNGYRENSVFVENADTMLEDYASLSDMFGCDAYATYTKKQPLIGKMMQYDLMRSIKDMPIVNAEDHVISDASSDFSAINADHIASDMWQGVLHGRSEALIWQLGKSFITTHHKYNSVGTRPDVIAKTGKTSLDVMRLANELNALKNRPYDVAILYSDASRAFNKAYLNSLYKAYCAFTYMGKKVRFVTENQLKNNFILLSDFPLLTVASAKNVFDSTLDKIEEYARNGGNVLIFDTDSLKYNEYNNLVLTREKIISGLQNTQSYTISYDGYNMTDDISDIVYSKVTNLFDDNILVKNLNDDENLSVAYDIVNYNGNTIINLCNYAFDNVNISVESLNGAIEDAVDLINGEAISTDSITLEPYKPVLLSTKSIKTSDFILSKDETDADTYSGKVTVKNDMFNEKFEATFILAVYNNDNSIDKVEKLTKDILPGKQEDFLIENIEIEDNQKAKMFLWNNFKLLNPVKLIGE